MAEPLSITAASLGLLSTVTKVSLSIHAFVQGIRGAQSDMQLVSQELLSLKQVLEGLIHDSARHTYSPSLIVLILHILGDIGQVVAQLEKLLKKYSTGSFRRTAQWSLSGKAEIDRIRLALEGHKSVLNLALDSAAL
jgi:hypothetical protein